MTTATVVALLVTFGGAVGAQEASPEPGASSPPEQLAEPDERLVTATCLGKPATIVAIEGVETVGTAGADVIVGTDGDDTIRGGGGDDRICAGDGADTVEGGEGKDRLDGGPGDDRLFGGAGKDTLDGGPGHDVCKGGPGQGWLPSCNDKRRTTGTLVIRKSTRLDGPHQGPIVIDADRVTLDCAGYTVMGRGGGYGILLEGRRRVTVRRCEVTNFATGIRVTGSRRNAVYRNFTHDNAERGLELNLSDNNTINLNRAVDNGFGRPATSGFDVQESHRNLFKQNTASGNSEVGFNLVHGSDRNLFANNTVRGTGYAFQVDGDRNAFRRNHVSGARYNGFASIPTSDKNEFTKNTVTGTLGGEGFAIAGAGNTCTGNRSDDNAGVGFRDASVPGTNTYEGNTCVANRMGGSSPAGLCDDTVLLEPELTPEPAGSPDPVETPSVEE